MSALNAVAKKQLVETLKHSFVNPKGFTEKRFVYASHYSTE